MNKLLIFCITLIIGLNVALFNNMAFVQSDFKESRKSINDFNTVHERHAELAKSVYPFLDAQGDTRGTVFFLNYKDKDYGVSNAHVCVESENGHVQFRKEGKYNKILKIDVSVDVCIFEHLGLEPSLTPNTTFELSDFVQTTGFSAGKNRPLLFGNITEEFTITEVLMPFGYGKKYYETTVIGYPGASGSPVVNKSNEAIGVMSLTHVVSHYLSFLPIERVLDVIDRNNL